jgi:hypothetical protein
MERHEHHRSKREPNVIGSDALTDKRTQAEHNLFSFTLEESELETALKRDGSFYINDMVNKFIPGASCICPVLRSPT